MKLLESSTVKICKNCSVSEVYREFTGAVKRRCTASGKDVNGFGACEGFSAKMDLPYKSMISV